MATSVQLPQEHQNINDQPTNLVENMTEEGIEKMAEALKTSKNLDQLLSQFNNTVTKNRPTVQTANYETAASMRKSSGLTESKTAKLLAQLNSPFAVLYDSDEEECTFHPKINKKSHRLPNRNTGSIAETLYKGASEKAAKEKDTQEAEKNAISKRVSTTKIDSKSFQIVLQKLQKSLKTLISEVEDPDKAKDQITFEGLGMILYRIGVFQNLNFISKDNEDDEQKSSLSINPAKAKPDRLSKEILLHENFWKILNSASQSADYVSSELTLKALMSLVEVKTPLDEAAALLNEILNAELESTQKTYAEIKDEKNLWAFERLITEFRKLFDDRTSFMNIYSSTQLASPKNPLKEDSQQLSFRPQINEKSQKLDNRYFSEKVLKNMTVKDSNLTEKDLKNRNNRLYKYHNYLVDKKSEKLTHRIEEELAPCSFVPKTTPYKKPTKQQQQEQAEEVSAPASNDKGYFAQCLNDTKDAQRHLLLYSVAQSYKEKLQLKTYNQKKVEEAQQLAECTFKPKVKKLAENEQDFYDGVPKGFKKTVDRMYKGEQKKQQQKTEKETIPRGENYEKNRKAEFKPPAFLQRPKIQKKEVLVSVDVSIGSGKTGKIAIHKGDDPKVLAQQFARTHSLNAKMRDSLHHLLQSYINNYFEKLNQEAAAAENHGTDNQEEELYAGVGNDEHEQDHEDNEEEENGADDDEEEELFNVEEDNDREPEQHHEEPEHHEEEQQEEQPEEAHEEPAQEEEQQEEAEGENQEEEGEKVVEVEEIITERNEDEEHEAQKGEEEN